MRELDPLVADNPALPGAAADEVNESPNDSGNGESDASSTTTLKGADYISKNEENIRPEALELVNNNNHNVDENE